METIEIRCPVDSRRLFTKLVLSGEVPSYVEGNLIEFSCDECKAIHRKRGSPVFRVLHRYNFVGDLVETEVLP